MDQADTLRKLMRQAGEHRARVIAVASGKGGVGKTCVSINLAVCLARSGRRVVLLDADLGNANADVLCNITPRGTLAHVVAGRMTVAEVAVEAPGGFRLIPGTSGLANMAALSEFERARLVQMVSDLGDDADLVLIDTSAGIGPNVLAFLAAADEQVIVTTPEPTSITDAYAAIKTLRRVHDAPAVQVVVNLADNAAAGRETHHRIDAAARHFLDLGTRYAGHVPRDELMVDAVRRRRPLVTTHPRSPASAGIAEVADRLGQAQAASPDRNESMLRRMAGWLAG